MQMTLDRWWYWRILKVFYYRYYINDKSVFISKHEAEFSNRFEIIHTGETGFGYSN